MERGKSQGLGLHQARLFPFCLASRDIFPHFGGRGCTRAFLHPPSPKWGRCPTKGGGGRGKAREMLPTFIKYKPPRHSWRGELGEQASTLASGKRAQRGRVDY